MRRDGFGFSTCTKPNLNGTCCKNELFRDKDTKGSDHFFPLAFCILKFLSTSHFSYRSKAEVVSCGCMKKLYPDFEIVE